MNPVIDLDVAKGESQVQAASLIYCIKSLARMFANRVF